MTKKKQTPKTSFFFPKVSFDEAFPTIQDISVKASEQPEYREEWPKSSNYDKILIATLERETIKCRNPKCDGGFNIGSVLRRMVAGNENEFEIIQLCNGREVHSKGSHLQCPHRFKVKVSIKYKED